MSLDTSIVLTVLDVVNLGLQGRWGEKYKLGCAFIES